MKGLEPFIYHRWYPLSFMGLTSRVWSVHAETIIDTWIVLCILITSLLIIKKLIQRSEIARFVVESSIGYFMELCEQTLGYFSYNHFAFTTSLFVFILLCNALSTLFPWSEEPTTDINTALGLGITSFLYIQWFSIQTKGLWPYIKGYFSPMFIMFPLNVVGKLANIVSISFRLFGNIFGGALISKIYHSFIQGSFSLELFGLTSGFNLFVINIYFGLFEGLIQAFVFSMLTMTYLSIALQAGEDGGH